MPKLSTRAVKDLVAICAATGIALFLTFRFGAFENFERWTRPYERWG
jgi:hypothetical protein